MRRGAPDPLEPPEHPRLAILEEIDQAREEHQATYRTGVETVTSRQGWVSMILFELAKATENQGQFRPAMIQAAALILGALEADALGYFDPPQPEQPEEPY